MSLFQFITATFSPSTATTGEYQIQTSSKHSNVQLNIATQHTHTHLLIILSGALEEIPANPLGFCMLRYLLAMTFRAGILVCMRKEKSV